MGTLEGRLVELQCLEAHEGGAWHCAWSPQGTLLATCGADRVARLWGVDRSRPGFAGLVCVQVLEGQHTRAVRSVTWSGDGRRILTASFDGTVGVWEVVEAAGAAAGGATPTAEFECVATLEGHENEVKGACVSPSGGYVATCGRDKTVWVWEVLEDVEFELVHVGTVHTQDVKFCAWHPSRDLLVSGSYDDTVVLWAPGEEGAMGEGVSGEWHGAWKGVHGATVWDVAWDEGGSRMASCDGEGRVAVWRLDAGGGEGGGPGLVQVAVREGCGGGREVYSVDWAEGDWVAAGCGDDCVRVLSASGPQSFSLRSRQTKMLSVAAEEPGAHAADVNCVRWHPHAKRPGQVGKPAWAESMGEAPVHILASASDDGMVRLWQFVPPAKPRGWLG